MATAFALGVVEPWMSGIGGVGAALVYDAKSRKVTAFDFGGRSPKGLKVEDFKLKPGADGDLFGWPVVEGNVNTVGAKAVVAPTEPAGLALLHKTFGRQRWGDLVMPAVALARDGLSRRLAHDACDRDRVCRSRAGQGRCGPLPPGWRAASAGGCDRSEPRQASRH